MSDDPVYLLFALEEPSSDAVSGVESLVRGLNEERKWLCGEIALIDEVDETSVTREEDVPVWTLGGALTLTRPGDDVALERSQLADVEFLLKRLSEFTGSGPSFVIEYASEEIGSITGGEMERSLREGLLGEWRRRIEGPDL